MNEKIEGIAKRATELKQAYHIGFEDGKLAMECVNLRPMKDKWVEQAYQMGYREGYSKAENDYHAQTEKDRQSSYELGLNMAWEAARKIVQTKYGYSHDEIKEIFRSRLDAFDLSATEAIEKLRAYEEKKQEENAEIHVGDEVRLYDGEIAVITEHHGDRLCCVRESGCTSFCFNDDAIKTGRHFPEIESILRKMGGNE